jgi:predicted aspartyl protease
VRKFLVPVLITLTGVPAVALDRTRPEVPLAIDGRGGIVVDVRVNGDGPFKFILDTGAARSIVSDDLARALAAPVVAKSEVVTSAGSEMRLVVRLASIAVASERVDAILAPVLPAAHLAGLGRGVRGLLGQDFLSAFNYTLDYRHARLVWDDAMACDAATSVRMIAAEGRFVMVMMADGDAGTQVRLVPDTGAEVAVLFRGRSPLRSIPRVRLGAVTLRDLRPVVVDRDDEHADGLLPLHGFSSVSFAAHGACMMARK